MITPTAMSALISGAVLWCFLWSAARHIDRVPIVKEYVSWADMEAYIKKNPQLCLILTEIFNILMHGMEAHAIMFNLGGTIVNAAYIYGVLPTYGVLRGPLNRLKDKVCTQLNAWADQLEAHAALASQKEVA